MKPYRHRPSPRCVVLRLERWPTQNTTFTSNNSNTQFSKKRGLTVHSSAFSKCQQRCQAPEINEKHDRVRIHKEQKQACSKADNNNNAKDETIHWTTDRTPTRVSMCTGSCDFIYVCSTREIPLEHHIRYSTFAALDNELGNQRLEADNRVIFPIILDTRLSVMD